MPDIFNFFKKSNPTNENTKTANELMKRTAAMNTVINSRDGRFVGLFTEQRAALRDIMETLSDIADNSYFSFNVAKKTRDLETCKTRIDSLDAIFKSNEDYQLQLKIFNIYLRLINSRLLKDNKNYPIQYVLWSEFANDRLSNLLSKYESDADDSSKFKMVEWPKYGIKMPVPIEATEQEYAVVKKTNCFRLTNSELKKMALKELSTDEINMYQNADASRDTALKQKAATVDAEEYEGMIVGGTRKRRKKRKSRQVKKFRRRTRKFVSK